MYTELLRLAICLVSHSLSHFFSLHSSLTTLPLSFSLPHFTRCVRRLQIRLYQTSSCRSCSSSGHLATLCQRAWPHGGPSFLWDAPSEEELRNFPPLILIQTSSVFVHTCVQRYGGSIFQLGLLLGRIELVSFFLPSSIESLFSLLLISLTLLAHLSFPVTLYHSAFSPPCTGKSRAAIISLSARISDCPASFSHRRVTWILYPFYTLAFSHEIAFVRPSGGLVHTVLLCKINQLFLAPKRLTIECLGCGLHQSLCILIIPYMEVEGWQLRSVYTPDDEPRRCCKSSWNKGGIHVQNNIAH